MIIRLNVKIGLNQIIYITFRGLQVVPVMISMITYPTFKLKLMILTNYIYMVITHSRRQYCTPDQASSTACQILRRKELVLAACHQIYTVQHVPTAHPTLSSLRYTLVVRICRQINVYFSLPCLTKISFMSFSTKQSNYSPHLE